MWARWLCTGGDREEKTRAQELSGCLSAIFFRCEILVLPDTWKHRVITLCFDVSRRSSFSSINHRALENDGFFWQRVLHRVVPWGKSALPMYVYLQRAIIPVAAA